VHIPGWVRPAWLHFFLHHSSRLQSWVLAAVTTVGKAIWHVDLDYHSDLGQWDADTAQDWAGHQLQTGVDEHDLRPDRVTEWRPIVFGDKPGWTPLFDSTDPSRLPWTDLAATTGSRRHPRRTTAPGHAGIANPATASNR
jgi:hypothetical protein